MNRTNTASRCYTHSIGAWLMGLGTLLSLAVVLVPISLSVGTETHGKSVPAPIAQPGTSNPGGGAAFPSILI